jgi:pimeloyl-ACP methyl ester carboxylesterase
VTGIGISRGCNALVWLAHKHPDLVRRLLLVGCPPDQMGPGSPVQRLDYHGHIERFLRHNDLEGLMRYVVSRVYSESDTQDLGQSTVIRMMMIPKETLLSFYDPDPGMDIKPLLPDIRVPTLIAHGTADRQVPFAAAEYLAAHVPGAVLYAFEGYGHAPQFTATHEFCHVLREFVRTGKDPKYRSA